MVNTRRGPPLWGHRYGGPAHELVVGDGVVNVFSFSKAYGMMGWRVGYLLAPSALLPELAKAQDTVAICPTGLAQEVAAGALEAGSAWVEEKVRPGPPGWRKR